MGLWDRVEGVAISFTGPTGRWIRVEGGHCLPRFHWLIRCMWVPTVGQTGWVAPSLSTRGHCTTIPHCREDAKTMRRQLRRDE